MSGPADSENKVAFLFPGQGSQYVGMGQAFLTASSAASLLMEQADKLTGASLRSLALEGPLEELTKTVNLQPAITAINLICCRALAERGITADYVVGHSLGEYSALCAAGVLSVEDTLALVHTRGQLMQREAELHPGAMAAVLGLDRQAVEAILAQVSGLGPVTVANHNSRTQIVISGTEAALTRAGALVSEQGGKVVPLKVSGAMHSPLMANAVADFAAVMAKTTFFPPRLPIIFNVTASEENHPDRIRAIMARQIAEPVRWLETIDLLVARDVRVFIEVGPKKVLSGLLKKILPREHAAAIYQVEDPGTLAACATALGR